MHRPFASCLYALLALVAGSARLDAQASKISSTAGGFHGVLDDLDGLGYAAASLGDLDGDGREEIAVGAPRDSDAGANRGAVWILSLRPSGRVWSEQKINDTSGGFMGILADGDGFGRSLASLGDVDGDGVGDLAVGAPGSDNGAFTDVGAVWILFLNADGTVKAHQKLDGSNGTTLCTGNAYTYGYLGSSLAVVGDLDGNGIQDLAVGNPADVDSPFHPGAVWIFFLDSDGTLLTCTKIAHGQGGFGGSLGAFDWFGGATAGLGDLNGDGVGDLAVGAPYDDEGGPGLYRGAVWILFLDSSGFVLAEQKISDTQGGFTGPLDDNYFGWSLASPGDVDGDGIADLAVGDIDESSFRGTTSHGAVWVLHLETDGTVATHGRIEPRSCGFDAPLDDFDFFGASLATMNDRDGDGIHELLVGAPGDDDGGPDRGAVWIVSPCSAGSGKLPSTLPLRR